MSDNSWPRAPRVQSLTVRELSNLLSEPLRGVAYAEFLSRLGEAMAPVAGERLTALTGPETDPLEVELDWPSFRRSKDLSGVEFLDTTAAANTDVVIAGVTHFRELLRTILRMADEVDETRPEGHENAPGIIFEIGGMVGFTSGWRAVRLRSLFASLEESRDRGASVYRHLSWEHGRVWSAMGDAFSRTLRPDAVRAELEAQS